MNVLFIANVGNRDVQLPSQGGLPNVNGARALGQMVLDEWETYHESIRAEILAKALRWVVQKHGKVAHVVLVASDQADIRYRPSDTITIAQVIERLLLEHRDPYRWATAVDNVSIQPLAANPANYDAMASFYDHLLPGLGVQPGDIVYMAVSGGTAAMAAMLLFKGIEHFQAQAHPLYVNEFDAMPTSLNVGRRTLLNTLIKDFRLSIEAYQYHAALRLLDQNSDFLREALAGFEQLRAVIAYARSRLNFDFAAAENALFGMDTASRTDIDRLMHHLVNDITEANRTEPWLLREVLYTAEISFRTGAYADFLGRAFRLSEGLTEAVLTRWAPAEVFETTTIRQDDGRIITRKSLSEQWLLEHPDALEFLDRKGIRQELGLTRQTLLVLADYFAGKNNTRGQVVKYLRRIDELGSYRNQMPFAHGYAGVSLELLKSRYKATRDDEMLRNLKWLYEQCTGQQPGQNPYNDLNARISVLLEDAL